MMINDISMTTTIQRGFNLPFKAVDTLLNGGHLKKIEEDELKTQILFFIERNEKACVSDLVDKFKKSPEEIISAIEKLEEQGKLRRID